MRVKVRRPICKNVFSNRGTLAGPGGVGLVFFDLDDTLLDHRSAARFAAERFYEVFSSQLPFSRSDFVAAWDRLAEHYVNAHFRGELSWEEQRRARIRELFKTAEPELSGDEADRRFAVYAEAYELGWTLFTDVMPTLEALHGREVGIITNGSVHQQLRKLERLGIRERFSPVVISEAVGAAKPDPRIFHEACRLAGRRPQECLYVGDRLETDAKASAAVGMRGVWLRRGGLSDAKDVKAAGVERIHSLLELPALLGL